MSRPRLIGQTLLALSVAEHSLLHKNNQFLKLWIKSDNGVSSLILIVPK